MSFSKLFFHCNELEIFFSDLKVMMTDFFKPGSFVEAYCSVVAVKHGKPDGMKIQFRGFL